ncbi:Polyphenol oxidase [Morus notabilis]|uniref:Polyphenol oxidase n=1 Tax=Morus notabilis TaxID=981085 RepID=W9RL63_9ROSA|nr:polyphenol oxidase I, chloroplastic [Morus notabilis]EXB82809.1 Polyphenol oxidase [Morus notabilis]
MASLPLTQPLTITGSSTTTSLCPFPRNNSILNTKRREAHVRRSLSSNAGSEEASSQWPQLGKVDRRNVLLGLGITGVGSNPLAMADPIAAPDLTKCGNAELSDGTVLPVDCCPPTALEIIDFKPPPFTKLRVRPVAHKVDKEYIAKYNKALSLMKALPDTDPRSFSQQADVHCAYCNSAYDQTGYPGVELQVHNSWLFYPFHRWYLYFYERILGKLIGDPTFAIPFWNWDHPDGMKMPSMFTSDTSSALYDVNRSPSHQPPYVIDLDYSPSQDAGKPAKPYKQQVDENLTTMYKQMVSGANTQSLFFGGDYRAGEPPENSPGSVESRPHIPLHIICGNENNKNGEDMGNFYSAGRDPLFYCHHGNVDRMWSLWKQLPGKKKNDITDPDWLNATFLFYDENAKLVRVKVAGCLDTKKLGYVYEQVDLPWLKKKPKSKKVAKLAVGAAIAAESTKGLTPLSAFPIALKKAITVKVPRPKKGRSKAEKEEEEEILVIEGIDYDKSTAVKFDVYVNDEDEAGPEKSEFAGSFVTVPHNTKNKEKTYTKLKLGITELLEDVGADDDEDVLVTLVPKSGNVTVGGVKIVYEY